MIYSFRANLLMRIWTGLLLFWVAMLIGYIIANSSGQSARTLIAAVLIGLAFFIGSMMALIGACRMLIAFLRAVLGR